MEYSIVYMVLVLYLPSFNNTPFTLSYHFIGGSSLVRSMDLVVICLYVYVYVHVPGIWH